MACCNGVLKHCDQDDHHYGLVCGLPTVQFLCTKLLLGPSGGPHTAKQSLVSNTFWASPKPRGAPRLPPRIAPTYGRDDHHSPGFVVCPCLWLANGAIFVHEAPNRTNSHRLKLGVKYQRLG